MKAITIVVTLIIFSFLLIYSPLAAAAISTRERQIQRDQSYQNRERSDDRVFSRFDFHGKSTLPVDSDNDGMPDSWETAHSLNPLDPSDAWLDSDSDQIINLFEYQLGAEPDNSSSPPTVTAGTAGDLIQALDNLPSGTVIRLREGIYALNYITFNNKVVMIQGGWNSAFTQRDLSQYQTILDGKEKGEILYFSSDGDQPVIILDGLYFINGTGNFGALNLLASETAFLRTSIYNCSFSQSTSTFYGGIIAMHNWDQSESDRTIANTLIAGNLASGICAQITEGTQARWRIINSTITSNENGGGDNGYGIDAFTLHTGILDIQIYNSILWGNAENDINVYGQTTVNSDYSDIGGVNAAGGAVYQPGSHNQNVEPRFFSSGNYHLQDISPCRDTGSNTYAPDQDLDGKIRPVGIADQGCYEYQTAPSPTPFPVSTFIGDGDYNGDGTDDIAIFRRGTGLWSVRGITRVYFGGAEDAPIPADWDGDSTADIGIFRSGSGLWAIRELTRVYFGASDDTAIPLQYNPSSACTMGIFRGSAALWAIRGVTRVYFGTSGDQPVPGDYDGDGTKEITLFRPSSGLWAMKNLSRLYFGGSVDAIVPGDYSGEGTWQCGIFRPSSGLWAIRGITRSYFGSSQDQAVPADYDGDSTDDLGIFRDSSGLWAVKGITRAYYGASGDIPVTR